MGPFVVSQSNHERAEVSVRTSRTSARTESAGHDIRTLRCFETRLRSPHPRFVLEQAMG